MLERKILKENLGHLKKLYCIYCHKVINHVEVREIGGYTEEDFKLEFNLGRFKDGVREPIDKLLNCSNIECQYNVNGRCWNSNYSYNCNHRPKEDINLGKAVDNNEK